MCSIGGERICISREIEEIGLSPSHQRDHGENCIIHITKKESRSPSREHATFGQPKTANIL